MKKGMSGKIIAFVITIIIAVVALLVIGTFLDQVVSVASQIAESMFDRAWIMICERMGPLKYFVKC